MDIIAKTLNKYDYLYCIFQFLNFQNKIKFCKINKKSNKVFRDSIKKIKLQKYLYKIKRQFDYFQNFTRIKIENNIKVFSFLEDERLKYLTELEMTDNYLVSDFSFLSNFKELKTLDLRGSFIANIQIIEGLKNLEEINLSRTDIKDFSPLQNLINLKRIGLYRTLLSDIAFLQPLHNLEKINLGHNPLIHDYTPLTHLIKLFKLNVQSNNLQNIDFISDLINLEELIISDNTIFNYEPLTKLVKLKYIDLTNNLIIDVKFLSKFINAEKIYITGTKKILKNIKKLPEFILKHIKLY